MVESKKIEFVNDRGSHLEGVLEVPTNGVNNYALYAHCFTCTMATRAAVRITRTLAERGIATLRFDFSGLGRSGGDFSDTTFSSDIADIIAAMEFLRQNYQAPELLIGHSLGGAAVLGAASNLAEIKAVATIGAPSEPSHVAHLFEGEIDKILMMGSASINLGGKRVEISRQFVEDIQNYDLKTKVANIGKALLILHSPTDSIVGIDNAQAHYLNAKHPKSFVSLAGSDHLLTKAADGDYVGQVIAAWSSRYLER